MAVPDPPPTLTPAQPSQWGEPQTGRETLQLYLDTLAPEAPEKPAEKQARLPVIVLGRETEGGEVDLVVRDLLGRGGMAEVRAAAQLALGRRVAIKRAKDPSRANQRRALLREAWVAGQLEHPGIVPVHLVGETPDGEAVVVMKELRGEPWDRMLRQTPDRRGEALVEHIEILIRVCQAAHFAHSRGIVHRDIKPSNVRLGEFGEVYLVDWGLACHEGEDTRGPAGTPAYMAPEMFQATGASKRMDVYLLGSVLHELWAGFPANAEVRAAGFPAMMTAPQALEELVRRCCAEDPADRLADAGEVGDALAAWLRNRGVDELVDAARVRLHQAVAAIAALRDDPDDGEQLVVARERLAGAHFGFDRVLAHQPDHPDALAGVRDILIAGVRLDLARQDPDAALAFLGAIEDPPDELRAEVQAAFDARASANAESERLERLGRRYDLSQVRGERVVLMASFTIVLVLVLMVPYVLDAVGISVDREARNLAMVLAIDAVFAVVAWRFRTKMGAGGAVGRALRILPGLLLVATIVRVVGLLARPDFATMLAGELWISAGLFLGAGDLFRYNKPLTIVGALGALGVWVWPDHGSSLYNVTMILMAMGAGLDVALQRRGAT
ncbi:MAG: protein kinase [Alphaproteobacteria bacterium]|nr:protein kinase [Alphaproteobacteria bacterium]